MKVGVYWFLDICPIWTLALALVFFAINILFIIRDCREGFPYNISVGSQQGVFFLVVAILIGATIVQRQPALEWAARWLQFFFMFVWAIVSIGVGIVCQIIAVMRGGWGTVADTYHNLFVVPLLVFFLGMVAPIIFLYGTKDEITFFQMFGIGWAVCLAIDILKGRLQQQKWLERRGIHLPLRIKE